MLQQLKKIGKQVLFLEAHENNSRNGEGAFIRLKNHSIMFAFSEFLEGSGMDEDEARISAVFSYDEGETWQDKRVLFTKKKDAMNIMSVSMLRMQDEEIAVFYCEKYMEENGIITDKMYMKISRDEGETWEKEVRCFEEDGYHVMNNDRVIRLKSGRILIPIARHSATGYDINTRILEPGVAVFSVSDDNGKTWYTVSQAVQSPFQDNVQFQEPGVYQHEDGTVWLWVRTQYGCQYMSFSENDGETWSAPVPGLFFSSPTSPMQVKKVGEYTLAIFNPVPEYCGRDKEREPWGRTPLVCAVSTSDGNTHDEKSFKKLFYLENDWNDGYCYPAIFDGGDYFLTAYYHSNGTGHCLNSTKVVKVKFEELE